MLSPLEHHKIMTGRDHRGMILHPELWSNWPYLPLKRGHIFNDGDCGVIIDERDNGYVVYITNLFSMPNNAEGWKKLRSCSYANVDELLAAGWEVD